MAAVAKPMRDRRPKVISMTNKLLCQVILHSHGIGVVSSYILGFATVSIVSFRAMLKLLHFVP